MYFCISLSLFLSLACCFLLVLISFNCSGVDFVSRFVGWDELHRPKLWQYSRSLVKCLRQSFASSGLLKRRCIRWTAFAWPFVLIFIAFVVLCVTVYSAHSFESSLIMNVLNLYDFSFRFPNTLPLDHDSNAHRLTHTPIWISLD